MGKYDRLHTYLADSSDVVLSLSFGEIERILGESLPASARKHQAWWANEESGTHGHARSWLDARYRTQHLDLNGQTVEFVRA